VDNYPHVTPGSRATLRSYASATGRLTKVKLALPVLDALASERRETLYTSFNQHIHNGRLAIKTKCPGSNTINT